MCLSRRTSKETAPEPHLPDNHITRYNNQKSRCVQTKDKIHSSAWVGGMFSLCPVTFLTGSWRVSRNKCLCWASSGRLEPAGAEAAQVRTGGCRRPLWPRLSPASSPLAACFPRSWICLSLALEPGFPGPEAPLPMVGWEGDTGHSPMSHLRLWQLSSCSPLMLFHKQLP